MNTTEIEDRALVRRVTAASIPLAVLVAWVVLCARFIAPFFFPVIWGAVLATAVWPLTRRAFPGSPKRGAIAFVLLALVVILVPSWFLFEAVANSLVELGRGIAQGDVKLPPPNERVLGWPLIGKRVFAGWQRAAETPAAVVEQFLPQLRMVGRALMQSAGKLLSGILESLLAAGLAGLFLANAEACTRGLKQVAEKLLPGRGTQFTLLAGATVRSVAQGVIGIAVMQGLLAAIGLYMASVPAAGLWAGLVLMLAVMQLPPLLVLGPVAVYVFTARSTSTASAFLVWSIVVSASDGFLKPLVLGRGVGVPALVILIGAIGGMITDGIVGLFVGAVVLAVGYQLAAAWISDEDETALRASLAAAGGSPTALAPGDLGAPT
jgi:predicted PurR-regulated permease PerM